jgi:hypothetical protein
MEFITSLLSVIDLMVQTFSTVSAAAHLSFSVQGATACTADSCPGSFYTAVTVAWANIGYMTHADVIELIDKTNFGKWGILLYIGAAVAALIGVATNSPMRNYTWFFLGPAFYSFLVGTTMEVQGVNWVVANKAANDMSDVWRIAETGLKNTRLVTQGKVGVNGKNGPSGRYTVAYPMVFLDGLFSATTNQLVEFTGVTNESGDGGANSNLAAKGNLGDGPWWLLSTLKWPMLENIVGATVRNPSLRDALVTFLSSECGDEFKKGINSGAYIAATQARGTQPIQSLMGGSSGQNADYAQFQANLDTVSIPTPRSLMVMLRDYNGTGSLGTFTPKLNNAEPLKAGRGQGIVCSEYLWTIIQGLRWEAGHSYHQLLRAAPSGFSEESFNRTLFYGWDIRSTNGGAYASKDEQAAFVKHLILAFILRNELLYAPQVTSYDQRFAPSEQSKSYGDAYVRTSGSKMKYTELYNAAVMMPYIQGIIAYLLIAAYPIATMLVILPGHYKGFFTWVAFFAWVKLWDVGFAMVQVIERSVWAMLGSGTNMAQSANTLLTTAKKVGGIGVQGRNFVVQNAADAALPIPAICSLAAGTVDASSCGGADQTQENAWELFDKLLIVSANADLDLANGWYIYIMSALYLAVPAVTGQLVLGAKAGMAGMAKDAFQGVGNDAGGAARTGYQHAATNTAMTNQGSLGQAAAAKAMRKAGANGGGAGEIFGLKNEALNHGVNEKALGNLAGFHSARAGEANRTAGLVDNAKNTMGNALPLLSETLPAGLGVPFKPFKNVGGGGGGGGDKAPGAGGKEGDTITPGRITSPVAGNNEMSPAMKQAWAGANMKSLAAHQRAAIAGAKAAGFAQDAHWRQSNEGLQAAGKNQYAGNLQEGLRFDSDSAVWEAKNAFASHVASSAGIAGMNAGSLSAGHKPSDMTGMAMNGVLDGYATGRKKDNSLEAVQYAGGGISGAAGYSGHGFLTHSKATMNHGLDNHGSSQVQAAFDNQSLFSVGVGGQLDMLNPNVYGTVPNINGSTANLDLNNLGGVGLNQVVTALEKHSGAKLEGLKSPSTAQLDSIDTFPQPPKSNR